MADAVRTGTTIQQENAQLKSRGFAIGMLDEPATKRTWYRPDGLAIPNLPCDDYHRMRFIARGWTLTPPPAQEGEPTDEELAEDDEEINEGSRVIRRKSKSKDQLESSDDEEQE